MVASKEGLNYVNLGDTNQETILVSAEKIMKTLNKGKYFSSVENFAASAIPYTQRHVMWIKYKEEKQENEKE